MVPRSFVVGQSDNGATVGAVYDRPSFGSKSERS